ncbi:GNAT family N-acetyltransferase [Neptunitalea lumnitzerae]|uniref:N-acetyltransferase n=1 Tax=Neptunitalea lumnitzerae TaxID=2965509 RepID=A0ABQ5ML94_9FLAO|nr:GNAT family N-acetyltransferase [Neptunitalea sp. Y10]GLB50188.1 N-acetyltransferase [Neptunitalea sp. Y10]
MFTLKKIERKDVLYVFSGLSNPDIIKYYGISFDTLEATQEQMIWYDDLLINDTGIWWKIVSKDNCFVGACGFNDMTKEKAEIGFWILPDFWKQGYAFAAVSLIVAFAFETLRLNQLEAFVDSRNRACLQLLSKLGFKHIKTYKNYEDTDGSLIDLELHVKVA